MKGWVAQVRKGLVELCVLAALRDGEAYGYELLQKLGRAECLAISESTVYPILARLAEEGMVNVRTAPSPAGPPRRYYRLTPAGAARLESMRGYWAEVRDAVDALAQAGPPREPSPRHPAPTRPSAPAPPIRRTAEEARPGRS
jgi:PadR family transcriptional regulator, regulatory protein PadR